MRKIWLIFFILSFLILNGCQAATPVETTPTKVSVEEDPTTAPAKPTEEVVEIVDYCISCHTDKEMLISTAKVEEVLESESSGVG